MISGTTFRNFGIILASLGCTSCLSGGTTKPKAVSTPPNIVMIIVDDLRPAIGAFGDPHAHTPNMDRIASMGTLFEQAYVQWPVCGPSRASLLSGLSPETSGVFYIGQKIEEMRPDSITLPRHFKHNGYQTYSVGKIYHDITEDSSAWSTPPWQVVDASRNWQGYASAETSAARQRLLQEAKEADPSTELWMIAGPSVESSDLPDDDYRDGKIASKAVDLLKNVGDDPFFMAVGLVKPHLPFAAPKQYWDIYNRDTLPHSARSSRPKDASDIPYLWSELDGYSDIENPLGLSDEKARELTHGYYASVSFVDAQIGLILDELERQELDKNTIIALLGDHGFLLGDLDLWGKHALFERALWTPLIISMPSDRDDHQRASGFVEFVDLYPTLSDLAGLPQPREIDGISLSAMIDDTSVNVREIARSSYQHFKEPYRDTMGKTLRTENYRYTEWKRGDVVEQELYKLDSSRDEDTNLASLPEYQMQMEELSKQLNR